MRGPVPVSNFVFAAGLPEFRQEYWPQTLDSSQNHNNSTTTTVAPEDISICGSVSQVAPNMNNLQPANPPVFEVSVLAENFCPVSGLMIVMCQLLQKIESNQNKAEKQIDKITRLISNIHGNEEVEMEEESAEIAGRKRLKERLKQSMKKSNRNDSVVELFEEGWIERIFGICRPDAREGKQGSRLIHPASPFNIGSLSPSNQDLHVFEENFAAGMIGCSLLFLLYTAVVAPVQVCIMPYNDPCEMFPTLPFDVVVDSFFIIEVFVQFFLGFQDADGKYIDDWKVVAYTYVSLPQRCFFDCITSIPFSYVDLGFYLSCEDYEGGDSEKIANARTLRVMKILRIFRVVRMLKLVRLLGRYTDYAIIHFGALTFKTLRLLLLELIVVHVFACIFWKVKVESSTTDQVQEFLESRGIPIDDFYQIYLVCFYFVFTVFTTVGFGDISATTSGERVYCIFLFLAGASLFATLIAQFNEILSSYTKKTQQLDAILEAYVTVQPRLNIAVLHRILGWVRFRFHAHEEDHQHKIVLSNQNLPESLRLIVAKTIENHLFSKISYLSGNEFLNDIHSLFSAELLLHSTPRYFTEGTLIAEGNDEASGLMVITSGSVRVELPLDSEEADAEQKKAKAAQEGNTPAALKGKDKHIRQSQSTLLYTFERGDCLGEAVVIEDLRWAGAYGIKADFIAKSNCSILFIKTEDIMKILDKVEFLPIKCRIARAKRHYSKHVQDLDKQGFWKKELNDKSKFFWIILARHVSLDAQMMKTEPTVTKDDDEELPMSDMSEEQQKMMRDAFNLFDTDGDGCMDSEELEGALYALGFEVDDLKQLKGGLPLLNDATKTSISEEDFRSLLMQGLSKQGALHQPRKIFAAITENFNNASRPRARSDHGVDEGPVITLDMLRKVAQTYSLKLTEQELKSMIDVADRDHTGEVSLQEFCQIMKNTCWF